MKALSICCCILLILVFSCQRSFVGNIKITIDSFYLDAEHMNGYEKYSVTLNKDKPVEIEIKLEQGSLDLVLTAPDGTVVYEGNGTAVSDFSINISLSGIYTIEVGAHDAKGVIDIKQEMKSQ